MTARTAQLQLESTQRIAAGLVALIIGAGLIFVVGLWPLSAAHNAAHDTRHAIGFPCH
jgi:cobalt transporter subunit CbtB